MRYTYLTTITFFLLFSSCKAQQKFNDTIKVDNRDTGVYNRINAIDFEGYINKKTVEILLSDIGFNYTRYTYGTARNSYLRFVYFIYADNLWIEAQVNDFKFLESFSKEHKWNIEEFKKEKIGAIRFVYKNHIIKSVGEKY